MLPDVTLFIFHSYIWSAIVFGKRNCDDRFEEVDVVAKTELICLTIVYQ